MLYVLLEGGLAGVAPLPFGRLCETNISMFSQAMSWVSLSDFWRWRHHMRGQERQEKWQVWKMWEKWGECKQKVKQPRPWQGRAPLCQRQRRGQAPCPSQLPGRDEAFYVYQGVDDFLQTGVILQIEDQQRNRTRKSKNIIWGMSSIHCDLGLNPTIIAVVFVVVVAAIIKKGGRPNSGDFNDLLSRIEGDLRWKRTYTTSKKARSGY